MSVPFPWRSSSWRRGSGRLAVVLVALFLTAPLVQAQDAGAVLKTMADHLAAQQSFSFDFDADIEVITPAVEKIQFTSSGHVDVARPDRIRATRTGGYADVELVFDGTTLSVLGRNANIFAVTEAAGSLDSLVERLRDEYGLALPAADLLLSNVYDVLMEDVIEAKHIGRGVVDGAECEHLAFRNADTDWQIWIEVGDNPIPRKFVITSKGVNGAPQYTLRITNWQSGVDFGADAFAFAAPEGVTEVEIAALPHLDEVPEGTVAGANP